MGRDRLSVESDHDRLEAGEIEAEDAGIGSIDQTQPDPFARADHNALRHQGIDGDRVADAAVVHQVMPVVEIVADRSGFCQPPVVQHPGQFAVDANGLGLLDDQRTVETAPHLHRAVLVRVIPEGAGIDGVELVGEGLTGSNRRLRQMRHAIHGVGRAHAVPVDGCFLINTVVDHDAHTIALTDADFRAGHRIVVGPDRRFSVRLRNEMRSSRCCPQPELLDGSGVSGPESGHRKHRTGRESRGGCEKCPTRRRRQIQDHVVDHPERALGPAAR
jgi:hypothetical protein